MSLTCKLSSTDKLQLFKNARAMVFPEVGQGEQKFSGGSKKSWFLCWAATPAPARIYLPRKARRG
jgi:hypothetical protein